jgi:hypothetical protein
MNQDSNSNEFDLGVEDRRLLLPPLKMIVNQAPKGYLNPLQMPHITAAQQHQLEKSIEKEGDIPNV